MLLVHPKKCVNKQPCLEKLVTMKISENRLLEMGSPLATPRQGASWMLQAQLKVDKGLWHSSPCNIRKKIKVERACFAFTKPLGSAGSKTATAGRWKKNRTVHA